LQQTHKKGLDVSEKESMLDSLMKGLGRQLGKRRREVHQAIDRFKEEANLDEAPPAAPAEPETKRAGQVPDDAASPEGNAAGGTKA
jgi:hypothetical protein